jgi:DNA-binding NtrC family response regulator
MASDSPGTDTDLLSGGGHSKGAPPTPLRLVALSGPSAGATLALELGTYRVGKQPDCDLVLEDPAVSRVHLLVEVRKEGVRFIDHGSTNGSHCQGLRFDALEGRPGMTVRIGRTDLRVETATAPRPRLPLGKEERLGRMVGRGVRMRELFAVLSRVAAGRADVLVRGETGTGKELCAEALHTTSPRHEGPFVVLDLAGVPPNLLESELFGHVRGAFTGATSDRAGAFERAHGGTLFLDEVGELPLEVQPRLLRVLERREVKRLGSNDFRAADVRVVAATHRDLKAEAKAGRFREDLYHRLAVIEVVLPPLRERREDIPLLVDTLLEQLGLPSTELSAETRQLFAQYDWPGNVRELRNAVARVTSLGPELGMPEALTTLPPPTAAPPGRAPLEVDLPFKEAKERLVESFERDYLAQLLRRFEGNLSRAARESGIHRVHLRRLLVKHGLVDRGEE